jgi:hypothetical protein
VKRPAPFQPLECFLKMILPIHDFADSLLPESWGGGRMIDWQNDQILICSVYENPSATKSFCLSFFGCGCAAPGFSWLLPAFRPFQAENNP